MNNQKAETFDMQDSPDPALLHGRLKNVNLKRRTAELHRYHEDCIPLFFEVDLDEEMLRNEDKYVEVGGHGIINEDDKWESVHVERVTDRPDGSNSFSLDEFLNNPNPKIFDPDNMITISEPFDVDEFLRIIRPGCDIRTGGSSDE